MSHSDDSPPAPDILPSPSCLDGRYRKNISPGMVVHIVQKQDQKTGKTSSGTIQEILTHSSYHPHGIKVRLRDGRVGRVQ